MRFMILILTITIFLMGCNNTKDSNTTDTTNSSPDKIVTEKAEVPKEWGNTHCPVMEGKVKEDGGKTTYQGKIVRFCCPKCIKKFNDNPQEYHDILVKYSSGEKHEGHDDHDDHSDHDH